jgi:hypothetical protein
MPKDRFTPGEWRFDVNCVVTDDEVHGIAVLEPMPDYWAAEAQPVTDDAQMRANGQLMAASKRLLMACELALSSLRAMGVENATVRMCENAISKARTGKLVHPENREFLAIQKMVGG